MTGRMSRFLLCLLMGLLLSLPWAFAGGKKDTKKIPSSVAEADSPVPTNYTDRILASEPWINQPFAVAPLLFMEKAQQIPVQSSAKVQVLFEQGYFSFDEQGRMTFRHRLIYRINSSSAVEGWAYTIAYWSPWHQMRPVIRARVVTVEGTEYWLDPKTIGEFSAEDEDNAVLTDKKKLKAPLPGITVGCVIEEETVVRDAEPYFAFGTVNYFFFSRNAPIHRIQCVIDVPDRMPFQYAKTLLNGMQEEKQTADPRRSIYFFNQSDVDPDQESEAFLPCDIPSWPTLAFATGESWSRVAREYAHGIDEKVKDSSVKSIVNLVLGKAGEPSVREKAALLLAWLQKEIRYTGLEFGEGAIIPRTPGETLNTRYGDCKDKSTLLVALLRQAGIPAYLVLLKAGTGEDVNPDLPGFGDFNHAIVYIPAEGGVWIDPTSEYSRAGELPIPDQNRYALIVRDGTTGLIKTPAAQSVENQIIFTHEFFLKPYGLPRLVETSELSGYPELLYRNYYGRLDPDQVREGLQRYAQQDYGTDFLEGYSLTDPADLHGPFQLVLTMDNVNRGYTWINNAELAVYPQIAFNFLPNIFFRSDGDKDSSGREKLRENDFLFYQPYKYVYKIIIHPPLGFFPEELPQPYKYMLGGSFLTLSAEKEGSSIVVTYTFDSGKQRVSPAEYRDFKEAIQYLSRTLTLHFSLYQKGEMLLGRGELVAALAEFEELIKSESDFSLHKMRLARTLLAAGMGAAARKLARETVAAEPDNFLLYVSEGFILKHDLLGRYLKEGYDRQGAIDAYQKALALNPSDTSSRLELISLYEVDINGWKYGADLDLAIQEYEKLGRELGEGQILDAYLMALVFAGEYEKVLEIIVETKQFTRHQVIYLVALSVSSGVETALEEAFKLQPLAYRQYVLETTANILIKLRQYSQAARVLMAAVKESADPAKLLVAERSLERMGPFRKGLEKASDFIKQMMGFVEALAAVGGDEEKAAVQFLPYFGPQLEENQQRVREWIWDLRLRLFPAEDFLSAEFLLDSYFYLASIQIDGDEKTGYRVRVSLPEVFFISASPLDFVVYIANVDGENKIACIGDDFKALAALAAAYIREGNFKKAEIWMEWIYRAAINLLKENNDGEVPQLFVQLWQATNLYDSEFLKTAAAVLAAEKNGDSAQIPVLVRAITMQKNPQHIRLLNLALAGIYVGGQGYDKLLVLAERWLESDSRDEAAFGFLVKALYGLGRKEEVKKRIQRYLELSPENFAALSQLADYYRDEKDFINYKKMLEQLLKLEPDNSRTLRQLAWADILLHEVTEVTLDRAHRAGFIMGTHLQEDMQLTAVIYAEMGRLEDAYEVLVQSINELGRGRPDAVDLYVLGRIAEALAQHEAALEYYARLMGESVLSVGFVYLKEITAARVEAIEGAAGTEGGA